MKERQPDSLLFLVKRNEGLSKTGRKEEKLEEPEMCSFCHFWMPEIGILVQAKPLILEGSDKFSGKNKRNE